MRVLVDTSIRLRFVDQEDRFHPLLQTSVSKLLMDGSSLGKTPQCQREFWSVATRPREVNGPGLTTQIADDLLTVLREVFEFWDDVPGISDEWRKLVRSLDVKGIQVHDANHAAAAIVHGATHVLTLDKKDFGRYEPYGLKPMLPSHV